MMHRLNQRASDSFWPVFVLSLVVLPIKLTPLERCAVTLAFLFGSGSTHVIQLAREGRPGEVFTIEPQAVQQAVTPSVVYASQAVAAKPVFQSTPKPLPIVNDDPWDEPVIAASTDNHFELMSAFCEEQRRELQNGGY